MMSDQEFMLHAFRGNQAAIDYVLLVAQVVDVWDNLIDKDVSVSDKDINKAFWNLAVEIPKNAFYRKHMAELTPVVSTGILNWLTANTMEQSDSGNALEIAHVIRYSIADVAILAALICGGPEWAEAVGPELRMRSQRSNFSEYINSLRLKREKNHVHTQ